MYSTRLIEVHFWVATVGIVLYIAALWVSGVTQGLMWRATNPDGTLTYAFVEAVKASYPYWTLRVLGGLLYLAGMTLMLYNMLMTIRGARPVDAPIPAALAAHA
jgi:cytochrome c oxidase cbb3-type subunit 1